MSSPEGSSSSAAKQTNPSAPATANKDDDDYKMQLLILDQQNKGRPGYVPAITDTTQRPHDLDGVIGNMFEDGQGLLICDGCFSKMYNSDSSLWPELKRHVHLLVPTHLRTGPDLYQCFCGYFSFRSDDLNHHLESQTSMWTHSEKDRAEVMADLMQRIEDIGMDDECQRELVAIINGKEHGREERVGGNAMSNDQLEQQLHLKLTIGSNEP